MLTNIASLDQKIDKWDSKWLLANDTPLEVCKEFHFQYGKYLAAVEDRANEMRAQLEAEEKAKLEAESGETVVEAEIVPITPEA